MIGRSGSQIALGKLFVAGVAALPLLLAVVDAGWAQAAAPASAPGTRETDQQQAPSQADQPPPREENPGLINEIGRLFEKPFSNFPSLKTPSEAIDDLNARTKDAGDALSRLAKPGTMVSGRIICPTAANGTPDCKAAADKLCQNKSYKEGKSLNTDSAQTCSAKVLIPGRARKPDDCRTDYYVTSALCQ